MLVGLPTPSYTYERFNIEAPLLTVYVAGHLRELNV